MASWKMTDEEREAMVECWRAGMTVAEIAREKGRSVTTVIRALRRGGVVFEKAGDRAFTDEQEAGIAAEYKAGASLNALAKTHGVNPVTIRNVLIRQGVARRSRGAAPREVPADVVADIAARWNAGESQGAIGASRGESQSFISKVLRLHGYDGRGRAARGPRHGNWRGGRGLVGGYVAVAVSPDSPFASMRHSNGYVLEHRLVMAEALGRPLADHETVHHIDGDRANNAIGNLQLRVGKHGHGAAFVCAACGSHDVRPAALG